MTRFSPRFRLFLATLVAPLVVGGCSVAGAGEGNAANEPPVTIRSGGWLIEGSKAFAHSPTMSHEKACVEEGNRSQFIPIVVTGLLREDMAIAQLTCTGPTLGRTGNLVNGQMSCSNSDRGTFIVKARGVISAEKIAVDYDFDLSKTRLTAAERAKAEEEIRTNPPSLTARRIGSCAAI